MGNRALAYAEDNLGVHRIWVEVGQLTVQLSDLYRTQAGLETETRSLDYQIEARRAELLVREADGNPEMNPTAFERHMKLVYGRDEELASIGRLRLDAMASRDAINAQIKGAEYNHRGHVGRMNELGGYFEYLAAAKSAATVAAQAVADYPW